MTRGLFFSLWIRIVLALAVVAVLLIWLAPPGRGEWIACGVLLLAWAAIHTFWVRRAMHRNIASLAAAVEAMPESKIAEEQQNFSDFDGLARALAVASQRVERALTAAAGSRRELEAMIDSMQDAVVAVDSTGRIQWTNEHMRSLLPGNARVGHALVEIIRDPDVLDCVRGAMDERTVSERRSNLLLPGRIFEVSASPTPGGGAVAVLHDITRIEQVERTQRDFVANVSHELRTPLTSISGYVETLLDHETSLSAQARGFLETILKNAARMGRLTEDLLVMARIESSDRELHRLPVSADLLVRDAVSAMTGLAQDRGVVLEAGETTDTEVMANTDTILQVLSNLIENGIKYGKVNSPNRARVVVSARDLLPAETPEGKAAVEFSVRDFGQGIASEHLSRIFERFYRVDKARSRESGGTGLGLAIARYVVEGHGGTIWAKSELNSGSTFSFTLPKAQNVANS
ncbi:sensor histidine kinase [Edaphobacter sp.]|uniref:sensor histidine kinase n=1 Tax=Edaphobacter sp. TaxID=1934404 RepID=UPI0039C8A285